ncbi:hypothetical protein EI983_00005 (plasmid) [Roseovarius faecimaris]|uniref:Uncharacterized protein n=1 Tax=Roseovarius faecimaris TaxID=2494550 RepID=A0A6I6ILY5_9RHOB|nr:hypothetical protein [Roseovarius faecimaris]QGX96793.1 hypothetical protein EI983_00005 [Roseovarius faecimaris]
MKTTALHTALLTLGLAAPALADQVISDDLIVEANLCVGSGDCVNGENFGNTDIRIKSLSPEIQFFDGEANHTTWTVSVDDQLSGVEQGFSIRDETNGVFPFVIAPNGVSSALFIQNNGHIGLGTTMPGEELHVTGTSPNLRLEDTIGTPYMWDVGGNNFNFFIEDVTGNKFPLRIYPSAPENSIVAGSNGNIGLGTNVPSTGLHLRRANGTGAILIEETSAGTLGQMTLRNNGITFFSLEDTSIANLDNSGRKWNFQNQNGTFRVTTAPGGAGDIEMILTPAGDMTIEGTLTTSGGTCGGGCDAVFSDDYDLPSITEHAEAMWSLGHLPNVGPTVENAPINVSDKLGRMLNELEHAHIYIDHLHTRLADETERNASQQAQIEALMARIDALEEG